MPVLRPAYSRRVSRLLRHAPAQHESIEIAADDVAFEVQAPKRQVSDCREANAELREENRILKLRQGRNTGKDDDWNLDDLELA